MRLTWIWAWATGVLTFAVIWFGGPFFIDWMAVNPDVREVARHYLFWAALAPLVGVACFQYDGIFTGATQTADMRNMMIVSLAIYMLAWWWLEPAYGNLGLWLSMIVFFVARGVTFAHAHAGVATSGLCLERHPFVSTRMSSMMRQDADAAAWIIAPAAAIAPIRQRADEKQNEDDQKYRAHAPSP